MLRYQSALFNRTKIDLPPSECRHLILKDDFLKHVYESHIRVLCDAVEVNLDPKGLVKLIEIGAAGGITKYQNPTIITLDVRSDEGGVDIIISDEVLPFDNESITGVIGKDVFHHIPSVEKHLHELERVLSVGAKCAYIEPNWNIFSRTFYTLFHPEPWNAKQILWSFNSENPMFSNQALPWIVFQRDLPLFMAKFPKLQVRIDPIPLVGLSYLISGGLARRNRVSSKALIWIYQKERRSHKYLRIFGLSRLIVITKLGN